MLVTFFVYHLDISGKLNNDSHEQNKKLIFITLFIFHLDMSGKVDNNLQL